jgi:hypothetical protein
MEVVGTFYGHLVHFTVFCYILWTFGIVRGNLVYFSRLGILYQEKSGNPASGIPQHEQFVVSAFSESFFSFSAVISEAVPHTILLQEVATRILPR